MTNLMRWNPLKDMEELQNRMTSLWGRGGSFDAGKDDGLKVAEWSPLVDITEDDLGYVIKAELPEVLKEDVKVTVEHGMLRISGERKFEHETDDRRYRRLERSYGSFLRSFTLPDDANAGSVTAEFKDGVLRVHVLKDERARPKSIEIKVA